MKTFKSFLQEDASTELKNGLLKLTKTDYDTIDILMKRISKKHEITPKELHNLFKNKYKKIPDNWIKERE
jgi:hypothetical protein